MSFNGAVLVGLSGVNACGVQRLAHTTRSRELSTFGCAPQARLDSDTVKLAKDHDAVVLFVNDDASAEVGNACMPCCHWYGCRFSIVDTDDTTACRWWPVCRTMGSS